jgi:hypothetical protein
MIPYILSHRQTNQRRWLFYQPCYLELVLLHQPLYRLWFLAPCCPFVNVRMEGHYCCNYYALLTPAAIWISQEVGFQESTVAA